MIDRLKLTCIIKSIYSLVLSGTLCGSAMAKNPKEVNSISLEVKKRPNIIFVLVDDQRFDMARSLGTSFLQTPNIDRLVKQGVLFKNAFVTTSLCSPSRGSFLTGTYAHTHGVRGNELNDPDPAYPTFPQVLQKNGYTTAYIGKWHMANGGQPRAGYDYWLSFNSQGIYNDPDLNENGKEFKKQGYMTDILNEYALSWLKTKKDKPFCLYLSHKAVHAPFEPADRHKNLYKDATFPYSPSHSDSLVGKPQWQRANALWRSNSDSWMENSLRTPPLSVNKNKAVTGKLSGSNLKYYQCINSIDEGLGEILKLLKEQGELDNTVIIYAGDNGQILGEHQTGDKRLAYETSIRIPYIMYYPAGNAVFEKGISGNAIYLKDKSFISNLAFENINIRTMPLTWTAWIKPDNNNGVVLAQGNNKHGYSIFLKDGKPHFCIQVQGWGYIVAAQQPLPKEWSHIAGVISSDYFLKLYVNGKLVAKKELPRMLMMNSKGPLEIGADHDGFAGLYTDANYFQGLIDEVKFYQGSLSEKQIEKEANNVYSTSGRASNTQETSLFNIGFRCAANAE